MSSEDLGRDIAVSRRDEASSLIHPSSSYGMGDTEFDIGSPGKEGQPATTWKSCLTREPLLLLTLIGVIVGVTVGGLLRYANVGPTAIDLIGFPGELMLRLLKMLVLPLVAFSMVSGVCSINDTEGAHSMARLAKLTAAYYIMSTVVAIIVGLLLVVVIQPGRNAPFERMASAEGCRGQEAAQVAEHQSASHGPLVGDSGATEAMLQVARMVVPENIVKAAVDMNVLGIITFSLLLGWALSSLGPRAVPVIAAVHTLNAAVGKMVTAALWISPLGVASLVAASMLKACDLGGTLAALGLWVATVMVGLLIFSGIILPAALLAFTRRSPLEVASHFGQALLLAFGTSSSAASLPLAMTAAHNAGCADAVVSFFLPLGISVNLSGTALYEATTAVFIAQAHGVALGISGLVVVAVTASLAAVGAPAIPSAGLVTMLIVLQAVGLDQFSGDLAVILAMDWILDRVRTTVNLLGDAYGCVIVDALMRSTRTGGEHGAAVTAGAAAVYQNLEMGARRVVDGTR